MPTRCVAAGCSSTRDVKEGISLHRIPFFGNQNPEAKKQRKRWVDFVKLKRGNWEPSKASVICSKHFKPEDFTRVYTGFEAEDNEKLEEGNIMSRIFKKDELGCNVFPTIQTVGEATGKNLPSDREKRSRRKVR